MTTNEATNLTPEFGSQPEDIAAFNELVGAVANHNGQFTVGALVRSTFRQAFQMVNHTQELIDKGLDETSAEEAAQNLHDDTPTFSEEEEMARAVVGMANMPALVASGLKISPQRVLITRAQTILPEQTAGIVRFQIADGGKFSNFLLNVYAPSDELQKSVNNVITDVVGEAKQLINDGTDNQVVLETLVYTPGVLNGLKHIGLETEQTKALQQLHEHAQTGDVKEYVAADTMQLLAPPEKQHYGPAEWQIDSTNEILAERWSNALELIRTIKANPKAHKLFKTVIDSTRVSLVTAQANWKEIKSEYLAAGNGSDYDAIFESVGLELDFLASED